MGWRQRQQRLKQQFVTEPMYQLLQTTHAYQQWRTQQQEQEADRPVSCDLYVLQHPPHHTHVEQNPAVVETEVDGRRSSRRSSSTHWTLYAGRNYHPGDIIVRREAAAKVGTGSASSFSSVASSWEEYDCLLQQHHPMVANVQWDSTSGLNNGNGNGRSSLSKSLIATRAIQAGEELFLPNTNTIPTNTTNNDCRRHPIADADADADAGPDAAPDLVPTLEHYQQADAMIRDIIATTTLTTTTTTTITILVLRVVRRVSTKVRLRHPRSTRVDEACLLAKVV